MDISIRKWKIDDVEQLFNILNNQKILNNLRDGIPYPYTIENAQEFISQTLKAPKNSQYSWAILIDDQVIGSVGVFRKDNIHYRTAEIGYYISEEYWGNGIMTKVMKEVCDYIFHETDILRLFAEPFAYNIASCRVLEKAGFELEGILRSNAIKNGQILDMKMYSIVR